MMLACYARHRASCRKGTISPVLAALTCSLMMTQPQPSKVFFDAHCIDCHDTQAAKGGLDLTALQHEPDGLGALLQWARVRTQLQARSMPPKADHRPEPAAYDAVLEHVEAIIDASAADLASAGAPSGRRLNRTEWRCAVLDLFGVHIDVNTRLPADEIGHGFDTVGDTLSLSPPLLEKFIDAAEIVAAAVVHDPDNPTYVMQRIENRDLHITGAGRSTGSGARMHSMATAGGTFNLPRNGRYRVVVIAHGQQAGDEPVRLSVSIAGESTATIDVPEDTPSPHPINIELPGGETAIDVTFINDFYRPNHPNPKERDRNAMVQSIEVHGPLDEPIVSDFLAALPVPELPLDQSQLIRAVVRRLLPRAWRRAITTNDVNAVVGVAMQSADGFHDQLRAAIVALLVHPAFLLRLESDPPPGESERALDGYEVATRMALLLWSSVPDAALLHAASTGELNTPEGRSKQLDRMLRDDRSSRFAEHFAPQWLQVRRIAHATPDPKRFPGVDVDLRTSMQRETIDTFNYLLRTNRPWTDLLKGRTTVIDAQLAAHYGITGVPLSGVHAVERPGEPCGVLGQAAVLLATSNPTRTSPVKRGKWVLEALLDAPPPPPPPGVVPFPNDARDATPHSIRSMLVIHRHNPECATCHVRMDELGYAMESFDAVGRPREGVDDRGLLPGDEPLNGIAGLRDWVLARDALPRSLARHLLTYAVGRGFGVRDETAIDAIADHLVREQRLSALLEAIIESRPFLYRGSTGGHAS